MHKMRILNPNSSTIVSIIVLFLSISVRSAYGQYVQTITKETTGTVDNTVCPTLPHSYKVNLPSNFGSCKISWTVTNGKIVGSNNLERVAVDWDDTPNATGTLTVKFTGCGAGNANEGTGSSKSELILSVNNQSWGTYTNNFNVDYCTRSTVTLLVPQMFVQGTGGAGQPAKQEVIYSWTISPGWQTTNAETGNVFTTVNSIQVEPTKCSISGTVQVEGLIIDRCGSALPSSKAIINLNSNTPSLTTVTPQAGFVGTKLCDRTSVTFSTFINSNYSCLTSYTWTFPASWQWQDPATGQLKSSPVKTSGGNIT